jgi:hypothetical protein
MGGEQRRDVFVSYAGPDLAWAEWVTAELRAAGYTAELDAWDWAAGENAVVNMDRALARSSCLLALISTAYVQRERWTTDEWSTAALLAHDDGTRVVPVHIEQVPKTSIPPLLRNRIGPSVHGLDAGEARRRLVQAVEGAPGQPSGAPYPDADRPEAVLPGRHPAVWNVPPPNPAFVGREPVLLRLRDRLRRGDRVAVQAVHGWGGVGKTQLATEYAHRFAGTYDLVWWFDAERPELVSERYAELATELVAQFPDVVGIRDAPTDARQAAALVHRFLRGQDRWLLVFDNADDPRALREWLPAGRGHVVITSRNPQWHGIAEAVALEEMSRPEALALLRKRLPAIAEDDADGIAARMGDLPLGLAQAAGYCAETGTTPGEYLGLLADRSDEVLAEAIPPGYPRSLPAAVLVSVDRLTEGNPGVALLARLCSYCAPEPIPKRLLAAPAAHTDDAALEPLMAATGSATALDRSIGRLARLGLVRVDGRGVLMHRLNQSVLRNHTERENPALADAIPAHLADSLAAAHPGEPHSPHTWAGWAEFLPHLQAVDLAASSIPAVRNLALDASWYLVRRGDARAGGVLARRLYDQWRSRLGADHPDTLWAANHLASGMRASGEHAAAQQLDADTLARRRRLHGKDHPSTLASACHLAIDLQALGDVEAARWLDADTLARHRRLFGKDHFYTLTSAGNLAVDLYELGEVSAARELLEDTLARSRRVLGDDHPDTLISASNLAECLHALGEISAARELDEDTLARRRRVLGDGHPDTLTSANNLAIDLRQLGEVAAARELDEDTLARRRRVLGEDHPDTLGTARNLAADLSALGEEETAQEWREWAAERKEDRR